MEVIHPVSYEGSIAVVPKSDKGRTKKSRVKTNISLMNIDTTVFVYGPLSHS